VAQSRTSAPNQQYRFRNVNGRRVVGSFSGGDISADAGLVLLANLERSRGLIKKAAESIRDMRVQGLVSHSVFEILFQRVALIAAGYEDAIDSNTLRKDAAVRLCLSKSLSHQDFGPSQPTVCRFENAVTSRDCYRLAASMLAFYIASRKPPKQIILDFDGSCIEAHGVQQLSCLRGHYELNMYFPLLVFDQDGWLITAVLRPGNHGEVRVALPVLKRVASELRKAWPKTEIIFRADAAFNSPQIYQWCESHEVFYVIGTKSNHALNVSAAQFTHQAGKTFHRKHGSEKFVSPDWRKIRLAERTRVSALPKKERHVALAEMETRRVRVVGDFYHLGKKWSRERRIIAVCDHTDQGPERRFVITNLTSPFPEYIYTQYYCKRGRAEQFIKELKSFKCTRLSCQEFYANQFRLLMHGLAYLLVFQLRNLLPEPWHKVSVVGIRTAFLKVAAQIEIQPRQISIRWSASFTRKREFLSLCRKLDALPTVA
jgi:hypothetical protein